MKRSTAAGALALAVSLGLTLPVSAFFWGKKEPAAVADLSRNVLLGEVITFSEEDFPVTGNKSLRLSGVEVDSLPDGGAGTLLLGGTLLEVGSRVERSALSGLRFQSLRSPTVTGTRFRLVPQFSDGTRGEPFTVSITLLTRENHPPVARNVELSTYKNVPVTGQLEGVDPEGDPLSYRLLSEAARGAVELAEDGSGQFVYRPYENKTGKDTFTYAAVDPAGNQSGKATVTVRIEKANTPVRYEGLGDHPAHKSALRLAQEGIYVGPCVGGSYSFDPEQPVTRSEFLAMAMKVAGLEPLEEVTLTGFADDGDIPAWSRGHVSAAVLAGAVRGSLDGEGAAVFAGEETVTRGQAAVMLDALLDVTDVPMEVFAAQAGGHWAGQAAADLACCGVLGADQTHSDALARPLTLGEAALMLDAALELA